VLDICSTAKVDKESNANKPSENKEKKIFLRKWCTISIRIGIIKLK